MVFNDVEYGATVTSAPKFAPSNWNWTPTTPTLSEAIADTAIVAETVEPSAGFVRETAGGTVSGAALLTVKETGEDAAWLPAASRAAAVNVCEPFAAAVVSQSMEYG